MNKDARQIACNRLRRAGERAMRPIEPPRSRHPTNRMTRTPASA